MTTQILICVITFILMMISFAWNKLPMGVTGGTALAILVITGCLDADTALASFGSSNVIIIVGMFVIGAGLKKLSIIEKITNFIKTITRGSFKGSVK